MNFLDRLASWEVRDGRLILRGKKQEPPPTHNSPNPGSLPPRQKKPLVDEH
jgi:hypothetical protein